MIPVTYYFNPRSRVGNDYDVANHNDCYTYFNPRSRVGNDHFKGFSVVDGDIFQSTFPRGERQQAQSDIIFQLIFQSTFPRGERLRIHTSRITSTYFNPRSRVGNDHVHFDYTAKSDISIHVPAWGTTFCCYSLSRYTYISIHVPAWGTTGNRCMVVALSMISIHVPAWGTTNKRDAPIVDWEFQSTFPRGERLYGWI